MLSIDRAAIGVSLLCLVHCLAIPVVLIFVPAVALFDNHHHWVHWSLLALAAPLSVVAFYFGVGLHRRWLVPILGAIGIAIMTLAVLETFGHEWESPGTVLGASLLAIAHWINQRALHSESTN